MKKTAKTAPKAAAKPKPVKPAESVVRTAPVPPAKARSPKPEPPKAEPDDLKIFDAAVQTFRSGRFQEAKVLFDQLKDSPNRHLAHAALLHSRMCEQRLAKSAAPMTSAEDLYNYGVALMNQRKLDAAQQQLEAALKMNPHGDHVSYALALCMGLKGDLTACYRHLSRAIELQPRNRSLARNDPDFADIARRAPLSGLLSRSAQ